MSRTSSTSIMRPTPDLPIEFTISAEFPEADDRMKTLEFLNAAIGVVELAERFGKVFASVMYDMNANIEKLRLKYEENVLDNEYLSFMILKEQIEGEVTATDALMWLRRGLHFLSSFFQSIIDESTNHRPSSNITINLNKAYMETLEQYHGWLGSQLLNVLSRFSPSRSNFAFILGQTQTGNIATDINRYNQKLTACVRWLAEFYALHGLETFATVIVM